MIFGEEESESPRVPSPWTNFRRGVSVGVQGGRRSDSESPRLAPTVASTSTSSLAVETNGSGSSSSSHYSPLSRAVRIRNAESRGAHKMEKTLVAPSSGEEDKDGEDEKHVSSLTSTPPTDEEDVYDNAPADGFFALDADLDVLHLGSSECQVPVKARLQTGSAALRQLAQLAPEPDMIGNLEYKLRILPPTRHRYDKLLTQLKWRMLQGGGECTYEIGVLDDGQCLGICPLEMRASLHVLVKMASELGATVRVRKAFHVLPSGPVLSNTSDALRPLTDEEIHAVLFASITGPCTICTCGKTIQAVQDVIAYIQMGNKDPSTTDQWLASSTLDSLRPDSLRIDSEASRSGEDGRADAIRCNDAECGILGGKCDRQEELESEVDKVTTFSLSLDERETQCGLGYHRRMERKACHYNARNAVEQRLRNAFAPQADSAVDLTRKIGNGSVGEMASAVLRHSVSSSEVETFSTRERQEAEEEGRCIVNPTLHATATGQNGQEEYECAHILFEVTVVQTSGEDAFIDYASF